MLNAHDLKVVGTKGVNLDDRSSCVIAIPKRGLLLVVWRKLAPGCVDEAVEVLTYVLAQTPMIVELVVDDRELGDHQLSTGPCSRCRSSSHPR